ncbi:hypothetical protein JHK86_057150 [Glycine max]|nr:hypothetical protein JHK86_057150 [Glycine max]
MLLLQLHLLSLSLTYSLSCLIPWFFCGFRLETDPLHTTETDVHHLIVHTIENSETI